MVTDLIVSFVLIGQMVSSWIKLDKPEIAFNENVPYFYLVNDFSISDVVTNAPVAPLIINVAAHVLSY